MGVPFNQRGRLTNEYLAALRAILDAAQPVSFSGDHVSFRDATFLPQPRRLPLWVAGSSEAGLARAVKYADGWMTVYQAVDDYRAFVVRLEELAEQEGRETALDIGYETYVCVAETKEEARSIARRSLEGKFETLERGERVCIVGDVEEVLRRIREYANAGARHVELKFIAHDPDQLHGMMAVVADAAGFRSGVGQAAGG
jgi:alkanesulfonate monooxygenase SsuD/methylene tetrahydromethanopterin reductase-like flavin-dependent oxidoreductase (luciferase family)